MKYFSKLTTILVALILACAFIACSNSASGGDEDATSTDTTISSSEGTTATATSTSSTNTSTSAPSASGGSTSAPETLLATFRCHKDEDTGRTDNDWITMRFYSSGRVVEQVYKPDGVTPKKAATTSTYTGDISVNGNFTVIYTASVSDTFTMLDNGTKFHSGKYRGYFYKQ